jgi:hypothetical protein
MNRTSKNFLKLTVTAGGIMLVAVALAATGSATVSAGQTAGASHVIVDNTSVPVTVGNASIPVTGSVGLAAGTQVGISGTPTVTVGNGATNPAIVRDSDSPGRQPFEQLFLVTLTDGAGWGEISIQVPPGKRWVIEHASGEASLPTGQSFKAQVNSGIAGTRQPHRVFPTSRQPWLGEDNVGYNAPFRAYADGEVDVIFWRSDSTGGGSAELTLVGYLIDI